MTTSRLFSLAGLSAIAAGIMFVIVGMLHVPVSHHGGLSSVTGDVWVLTHSLTIGVSFFGLLGIVGIYARQAKEAGWLGLAGLLLASLWLVLVPGFTLFEALILPLVAVEAPTFAAGFLGIFNGSVGTNFGTLATVWTLMGLMFILGPLLFGIATFRAGVLSKWAAGLFGLGGVTSVAFALLPPELLSLATVPVSLGLAWLGYDLVTERRPASEPVSVTVVPGIGAA